MNMTLEFHDAVALIRWCDGENRINPESLSRLNEILDELDLIEGPLAVVLTGEGKYFSNGLDLERFTDKPDELGPTVSALHTLFDRLVRFPAYLVAAINGHAFAGGAMLTCTADYRVMREDRGYWCLNEVELGLPLTNEMATVVLGALPKAAAREAMLTARRFDAAGALRVGIVDAVASESRVVEYAVERAAQIATKDRKVVGIHKRQLASGIDRFTANL